MGNTSTSNDASSWKITAQKTGAEQSAEGFAIATGAITVTDPDGEATAYPFRSGGHGRFGDDSALPGLNADVNPLDTVHAVYAIDWPSFQRHAANLPKTMRIEKTGNWLRLGSIDTTRGGVLNRDSQGFFGIHTDGPSGAHGSINDGTEGCLGMDKPTSDAFFDHVSRIPASQRPKMLEILPPQDILDALKATALSCEITAHDDARVAPAHTPTKTNEQAPTRF